MTWVCLPIKQSISQYCECESSSAMQLYEVYILLPQQRTLADFQPLQIPDRLLGQLGIASSGAQHRHTHSIWWFLLGQLNTEHMKQAILKKMCESKANIKARCVVRLYTHLWILLFLCYWQDESFQWTGMTFNVGQPSKLFDACCAVREQHENFPSYNHSAV